MYRGGGGGSSGDDVDWRGCFEGQVGVSSFIRGGGKEREGKRETVERRVKREK